MKIQEPITINGMELKNRIAAAPRFNCPAGDDMQPNQKTVRWFEDQAKGGVGFIMAGGFQSVPFPDDIKEMLLTMKPVMIVGFGEDASIAPWSELVKTIHSHDVKIGAQLSFPGPTGGFAPSERPWPSADNPKEMLWERFVSPLYEPISIPTAEELQIYVELIAQAAARVKAAGFDCVELHSCHGITLHGSFLSPFYNRRTDQYGGSTKNRARLTCETIQAIRKAVGPDYPVFVRISGDEFMGELGNTIKDTTEDIIPALEEAGVDCIDVSFGNIAQNPESIFVPLYYPDGVHIHLPEAIKKVATVPVIGVGKITEMEMAEKFLQEGRADIIYMGRQLIADPDTPKKYFEGRPEDIRKCVACLRWEDFQNTCGRPCAVNYDVQDDPIHLTPAKIRKKVLVIGGGVGGMEAAAVATLRGHKVTLMEKEPELGGLVGALTLNPLEATFGNLLKYQAAQLRKLEVDVRVCKEATSADVEELKPDVVILAAGATMVRPDVTKGKPGVMTYTEAVRNKPYIGRKVVIWGLSSAELAISLAQEGREVTLMGRGDEDTLAPDRDSHSLRRTWILRRLTEMNVSRERPEYQKLTNVEVLYHIDVEQINHEGIRIINRKSQEKRVLPYDTLIVCLNRTPNDSLYNKIKKNGTKVHKIGDCAVVSDIKDAISTANEIARTI
ncbi:MAG: FAD-dependent oxidoreductase [Deltaproteobacteria bacterium]|nr:FAD-dependent oxidoreductase [Deltaproteobacteria bacterium]